MSFCLGIKVVDGLVAIADTRITTGSERITARKLSIFNEGDHQYFIMTSGLRSVRDKVLAYLEDSFDASPGSTRPDTPHLSNGSAPSSAADRSRGEKRLFKVVNRIAGLIRTVAAEDKEHLSESGLSFNSHAIVGGQLCDDKEHKLYLIYPQGNWIEIGEGSPYQIIGNSAYGKPVIDRVLTYRDSMETALKVGFLSFDSTRISAADVGFPIDVALYRRNTDRIIQHRYEFEEMQELTVWWQDHLREVLDNFPDSWQEAVFSKLPGDAAHTEAAHRETENRET